jgi:hypothetical protein
MNEESNSPNRIIFKPKRDAFISYITLTEVDYNSTLNLSVTLSDIYCNKIQFIDTQAKGISSGSDSCMHEKEPD